MEEFFPGFQMDDHLFEPYGYSRNAIHCRDYYSLHVSPEASGSYVSFETNAVSPTKIEPLLKLLAKTFKPKLLEVISLHSGEWRPHYRLT
ncbi:MAG: hypothetical protein HC883_03285 [Bdellovibrionaceae bacterium]|nr:hypothetical protein [Pseudobdellovibrionaceae bacterium]